MPLPRNLSRLGVLLLLGPVPVLAQGTPSLQGFTGLLNTPNALVMPEGMVDAEYTNQTDNKWRQGQEWASNYLLNFGMFSFMEGGIRLYEIRAPYPYQSHFAANTKLQVPGLPGWMPKIALGMQDVGGAQETSFFRTRYGVMSEDLGPVRLSLGDGTGPSRMKGVFGGAEWAVRPWLQMMGEYDTTDKNLGAKVVTPEGFLPGRMTLGAVAKYSLDFQPHHVNLGFTLRVPLSGRRKAQPAAPAAASLLPARPHLLLPAPAGPAAPALAQVPPASLALVPPASLARIPSAAMEAYPAVLVRELAAQGFENLRAGARGATLVLEYENHRFNHNELDGLGLVLGTALAGAPQGFETFLVSIRKQDLRLLEVEGPVQPFRDFFRTFDAPTGDLIRSLTVRRAESFRSPEGVAWAGGTANPGWQNSRLNLGPGLSTVLGSELGTLDYRLSLVPDLQKNLWAGSILNLRWDFPQVWTRNYDYGAPFGGNGTSSTLQCAWLSQAIPLAKGLMAQVGGGQFAQHMTGHMADLAWTSPSGQHRFWAKAAAFQQPWYEDRRVSLAAYRYYAPAMDLYFEASTGRYFSNDKGYRLEMKRYFDDTSLSVFYTHTNVQTMGWIITLPLTPHRDPKPGLLQVKGTDRFTYGMETVVRNPDGRNPLLPNEATIPDTTVPLERTFYNNDRLNEDYLKTNLTRLREAYQTWRPAPAP